MFGFNRNSFMAAPGFEQELQSASLTFSPFQLQVFSSAGVFFFVRDPFS
jgi:hypothetical protein